MLNLVFDYGEEEIKARVPSNWDEVTVEQFIRIEMNEEPLSSLVLLKLLSGVDLEILENTKANLSQLVHESLLFFSQEPPRWEMLAAKDFFYFNGREYPIPKELELERFGQKVLIQDKLEAEPNTVKVIPYAVALYMQPVIYGKFIGKEVEAVEKQVMQMPVVEIYPLAAFFFNKLKRFKRNGVTFLTPYQKQSHPLRALLNKIGL